MDELKTDNLSKFYYTINKPLYYIINILTITPLVSYATFIDTNKASLIFLLTLILNIASISILYYICKRHKEKKNKLHIEKLSFFGKMMFITFSILILLISIIVIAIIPIIPILIK